MPALLASQKPMTARLNGVDKLLLAKPVNGTDWYLVVALDKMKPPPGCAPCSTSAVSLVLLVVVAALIIGLLIGALMRRLISIRDAMRAISSGDDDLTQRLPVTGHDECRRSPAPLTPLPTSWRR